MDPSTWIKEEKCQLLLEYLENNPCLSQALQARKDNDLRYGLAYIKARNLLAESACQAKGAYREIRQRLRDEDENLRGSWDDHVERLEFYRSRMSSWLRR